MYDIEVHQRRVVNRPLVRPRDFITELWYEPKVVHDGGEVFGNGENREVASSRKGLDHRRAEGATRLQSRVMRTTMTRENSSEW